jgi:predicted dehydrogenase
VKLAIIGLGTIAPWFLRAIEADPRSQLVAACDRDPRKGAVLAASGVPLFEHIDDVLGSGLAEGVIVTLPNDLHCEVAIKALTAGLHVCCEKPLAITTTQAEAMVAAAQRNRRALLTAFHRRYNRNVARLADALHHRREHVVAARVRYHENIFEHTGGEDWYLDAERCGGGCLIDNGPNALDALITVLGPLSLQDAMIGDERGGVEFCAELRLRTAWDAPVEVSLDWALTSGETKDIIVELDDGSRLRADMLAGFPRPKSSLDHEYAAIVADFSRVAEQDGYADRGKDLVRLVADAYARARAKERRLRTTSKAPVSAELVKLLHHRRDDRGMVLSPSRSRCIAAGELHELVTTTDRPSAPGDPVDVVGFIGFAAFKAPAIVERGDAVWLADRQIGVVAGFDECHAPNHLNIIIDVPQLVAAGDLDARVGHLIRFEEAT